jgi:hypothetical protein
MSSAPDGGGTTPASISWRMTFDMSLRKKLEVVVPDPELFGVPVTMGAKGASRGRPTKPGYTPPNPYCWSDAK